MRVCERERERGRERESVCVYVCERGGWGEETDRNPAGLWKLSKSLLTGSVPGLMFVETSGASGVARWAWAGRGPTYDTAYNWGNWGMVSAFEFGSSEVWLRDRPA